MTQLFLFKENTLTSITTKRLSCNARVISNRYCETQMLTKEDQNKTVAFVKATDKFDPEVYDWPLGRA